MCLIICKCAFYNKVIKFLVIYGTYLDSHEHKISYFRNESGCKFLSSFSQIKDLYTGIVFHCWALWMWSLELLPLFLHLSALEYIGRRNCCMCVWNWRVHALSQFTNCWHHVYKQIKLHVMISLCDHIFLKMRIVEMVLLWCNCFSMWLGLWKTA